MTTVAPRESRLSSPAELHVECTDIRFGNIAPESVAIEVTVRNRGSRRSQPTPALLMAAPFGALVGWQPLEALTVPALEPYEPYLHRTVARRVTPTPLGAPDRVPPRRLLTALPADGAESGQKKRRSEVLRELFPWLKQPSRSRQQPQDGGGVLPVDLFDLLGRGNVHWAGNFEVFVGEHAVERHLAQALRIYPGRINSAIFVVGTHREAYRFHLEGEASAWEAGLYDMTEAAHFAEKPNPRQRIDENDWVCLMAPRLMFLVLCPPREARRGSVEVHVENSSGLTAVVEFSLDANAAGPGCFMVE